MRTNVCLPRPFPMDIRLHPQPEIRMLPTHNHILYGLKHVGGNDTHFDLQDGAFLLISFYWPVTWSWKWKTPSQPGIQNSSNGSFLLDECGLLATGLHRFLPRPLTVCHWWPFYFSQRHFITICRYGHFVSEAFLCARAPFEASVL